MTPSRERLLEAHQVAARFYVATLHSPLGDGPREYLRQRALGTFVEDPAWTLGYAPPGWVNLTGHLRHLGFSETDIATAGLAIVGRRGALLDRFRDRIVLGLHDSHGALVGFVGRCSPKAAGTCPKYLNSPRTPLYAKGNVLFGLAEQRELLAAGATPVLVEGPLDVLGIASLRSDRVAVSPCGTAIRPEQARLLRSASGSTVVVAYDADDAGHRAARTAYERLAPHFDTILTARLPTGEDPAALAARNPSLLRHALIGAAPLADQLIDDVLHPFADRLDNA